MTQVPDTRAWRAGTGLLPVWEANHCCRCDVEEAGLTMSRQPPTMVFPAPPAPRLPPAQKQAAKDEQLKKNVLALMEGVSAVAEWFSRPPPPPPSRRRRLHRHLRLRPRCS